MFSVTNPTWLGKGGGWVGVSLRREGGMIPAILNVSILYKLCKTPPPQSPGGEKKFSLMTQLVKSGTVD